MGTTEIRVFSLENDGSVDLVLDRSDDPFMSVEEAARYVQERPDLGYHFFLAELTLGPVENLDVIAPAP